MSYLNQWVFLWQVIVDILRITTEKSWKEMFFQWKFPKLMKKNNWSQPSTASKKIINFKKKNQIWEWESSLQGMEVTKVANNLAIEWNIFLIFSGVKFCTLVNLRKGLISRIFDFFIPRFWDLKMEIVTCSSLCY